MIQSPKRYNVNLLNVKKSGDIVLNNLVRGIYRSGKPGSRADRLSYGNPLTCKLQLNLQCTLLDNTRLPQNCRAV